jgi:hypothetical protein
VCLTIAPAGYRLDTAMNEAAWLACADSIPMLRHLRAKPYSRKALLFTCACVRPSGARDRDGLKPWVALA